MEPNLTMSERIMYYMAEDEPYKARAVMILQLWLDAHYYERDMDEGELFADLFEE